MINTSLIFVNYFLNTGIFKRPGDGQGPTGTVRTRTCDVVRIARSAISGKFGVNFCTTCLCMFQFFKNQNAGAFTHTSIAMLDALLPAEASAVLKALAESTVTAGVTRQQVIDAMEGM